MGKRVKYTNEDLRKAVANNYSIASVLRELGIVPVGGNYQTIKKAIESYKLDTSHFTGKGWLRGKRYTYRLRSLQTILVYGKYENTNDLRLRLLKENIKEAKCESCNRRTWKSKPIPLELHHVDGDRKNNKLDNLEILCPNCHAVTDNYRGKNKRKNKHLGM